MNMHKPKQQLNDVTEVLLGNSKQILELTTTIQKLANTDAPVIINGPSGSGKELVALLLHQLSFRSTAPFIPVNCGTIPKELIESEFFGYKKGSFTGAFQDKIGLFQAAQTGTLFLDEIGDLPLDRQVTLLRAIQERCVRQVGSTTEDKIDVRFLGATNKNLRALVQQGLFREDLFYRINVIEITVPSLQERASDIPILITHIINKISTRQNIPPPKLSSDSLEFLCSYSFPGNVRELENILERAIAMHEHGVIQPVDLGIAVDNTVSPDAHQLLKGHINDTEKTTILQALQTANGSKSMAAKKLGISQRMLRYRLKKLGV